MKQLSLLVSLILLNSFISVAANFKSGDEIHIESAQNGDLYLAAGEITLSSILYGDLIASGGEITLNDSVYGDLLLAAGRIDINGNITDDLRITAGEVVVNGYVGGDIIFFGGVLRLTEDAEVMGDIVCFGGEISLHGKVHGHLKIYAGEVKLENQVMGNAEIKAENILFNGSVDGDMILQAEEISLGDNTHCAGSLRYWQKEGMLDFSGKCDDATFDEDLSVGGKENGAMLGKLFGIGLIAYWVIFILSSFLILLLLEYFAGRYFDRAAAAINNAFVKSFGYGMLYLLGIPVLIVLSFVIIVGFPIGLLALSLYGLSLLFATSVVGLCVGHYFKNRSSQQWTLMQTVSYSLISVVILKIFFFIPWLGTLAKTVAMASVYGAFLLMLFEGARKKEAL